MLPVNINTTKYEQVYNVLDNLGYTSESLMKKVSFLNIL